MGQLKPPAASVYWALVYAADWLGLDRAVGHGFPRQHLSAANGGTILFIPLDFVGALSVASRNDRVGFVHQPATYDSANAKFRNAGMGTARRRWHGAA